MARLGLKLTLAGVVVLVLGAGPSLAQGLIEGFDDLTTLPPAGWVSDNNSNPIGSLSWFQGNPAVFPAHQGATNAYLAANFNSAGNGPGVDTISNWMLTPPVTFIDGDTFVFFTRTVTIPLSPDRLQVRLSFNGSSTNVGTTATDVGDFITLLLDINPTYTLNGYPNAWTQQTITISGVPTATLGRFAFRYFVEDGGPQGANSEYIGIDTLTFTTSTPVELMEFSIS